MEKYIVTVLKDHTEWRNKAGELHRLDGPAVEFANGEKEYWIEGIHYTEEKFLAETTLTVSLRSIKTLELNFPMIVCLCGSTKFKEAFIKAMRDETLQGKIVLSVGLFGHQEGLDMTGDTKKMLDELHLRKIDLADEVLFLNVNNYIGESTRKELEYAKSKGKTIRFLEKH